MKNSGSLSLHAKLAGFVLLLAGLIFGMSGDAVQGMRQTNSARPASSAGPVGTPETRVAVAPVQTALTNPCATFALDPLALNEGMVSVSYGKQLTASGGEPPYRFGLQTGALPPGLTLSPEGMLAGKPEQAGVFNFMIKAVDRSGCEVVRDYAVTISPIIPLQPATLPDGIAGIAYQQTLRAPHGTAPYTFIVSGGFLPDGLTLSSEGQLSGVAATPGSFNFTVVAYDADNNTAGTNYYGLNIFCPTIRVTPATLPNGLRGAAYQRTLNAIPATIAHTFSIRDHLPKGLQLSEQGVLSGTPEEAGTFNFTIKVSYVNGCQAEFPYSLFIHCTPISLWLTTLPAGTVNLNYTAALRPSGGVEPYLFTVLAGNLPDGLTLSGQGNLTGKPTIPGTFNFTIRVVDAAGCAVTQAYSLLINCSSISLAPALLPDAKPYDEYKQQLSANGGVAPYKFEVSGGKLPEGLTLTENGLLTGNQLKPGSFNFTVQASDRNLCAGVHAYSLVILNPSAIMPTLSDGLIGTPYEQTFTTEGSVFSVSAGALPPGLTLLPAGKLSGTPTQPGLFDFTLQVVASTGNVNKQSYALRIKTLLDPPTLPNAQVGVAYERWLNASGGVAPYKFSVSAGSLPYGLTLTGRQLSGIPTKAGTFNFTIETHDANNDIGTRAYQIEIACPIITVSPATLPPGQAGVSYAQQLTASGGFGSHTFSISRRDLPPGIELSSTGQLTGIPQQSGTFSAYIQITSQDGCSVVYLYELTILCPLISVTPSTLPNGWQGVDYQQTVSAVGGVGPVGFSYTGDLPPGLSLVNVPGRYKLQGKPTAIGSFHFTVKATDAVNCQGFGSYELTILPCPSGASCSLDDINPGTGFRTVAHALTTANDFDGDGKADLSVWRAQERDWAILNSRDESLRSVPFGVEYDLQRDLIVSGDYDGDGRADAAVYRTTDGYWRILRSSDGEVIGRHWGSETDTPVPADYDGDGKTDIAVWNGTTGVWRIMRSSDGFIETYTWGAGVAPYNDLPTPGDYDGDGKADLAVFRTGAYQAGHWYIKQSSDGRMLDKLWGHGADTPVHADYDGDGKVDFAVWQKANKTWHVKYSSDQSEHTHTWENAEDHDVPVPGDYNGDGKADQAIWHQSEGKWHIKPSNGDQENSKVHGSSGDKPVPGKKLP